MENHNEKTYEMKQYELCLEWFEFMTNDLFIVVSALCRLLTLHMLVLMK